MFLPLSEFSNMIEEITFSSLKDIQVKEKQEVKQGDVIATYQQKFRMTFRYLGKNITYQEYLGM